MNKQLDEKPRAAVAELFGGRTVYYDKPSALQLEIDLRVDEDEIMKQVRELVGRAKMLRKKAVLAAAGGR
jgi:hypothetical protein